MLESVLLGLLYLDPIRCQLKLEGYVVNAEYSNIEKFPYSAFLGVFCTDSGWICGASILNQDLLLTAAHCLFRCDIACSVGNANRELGWVSLVTDFITHEGYIEDVTANDIGIIKLKVPLEFGSNVGRVAIMENPPYNEVGVVAGWGKIHKEIDVVSIWLQHTTQKITKRELCELWVGELPLGVICGGQFEDTSYPSLGDSGCALVVRNYIQVGIVSFKRVEISKSISMYTDTGYHYNWIYNNSERLYCND